MPLARRRAGFVTTAASRGDPTRPPRNDPGPALDSAHAGSPGAPRVASSGRVRDKTPADRRPDRVLCARAFARLRGAPGRHRRAESAERPAVGLLATFDSSCRHDRIEHEPHRRVVGETAVRHVVRDGPTLQGARKVGEESAFAAHEDSHVVVGDALLEVESQHFRCDPFRLFGLLVELVNVDSAGARSGNDRSGGAGEFARRDAHSCIQNGCGCAEGRGQHDPLCRVVSDRKVTGELSHVAQGSAAERVDGLVWRFRRVYKADRKSG